MQLQRICLEFVLPFICSELCNNSSLHSDKKPRFLWWPNILLPHMNATTSWPHVLSSPLLTQPQLHSPLCYYLNIASIFPFLGPCFSSSQLKKGFPSSKFTYFTLHSFPLPQVPANYHLHNVAFSDHLFNLLSTQAPDNLFTLPLFFK